MAAELLQKFSIKAKSKGGKLLSVVANPVTKHLPVNSLKIGEPMKMCQDYTFFCKAFCNRIIFNLFQVFHLVLRNLFG